MVVVLVYGTIFIVIALLALLFYSLSVGSRRRYSCPECGERIETEHLDAKHCSMCGAPLDRSS